MQQNIDQYFNKMWDDYCHMNPEAKLVYDILTKNNENVVNDHIAFRTFSLKSINKDILSQHFTKYGYKLAGEYTFETKKLTAKHFEHTDKNKPKVFISQIELELLSEKTRLEIEKTILSCSALSTTNEDFLFSGRPWNASYEMYKTIYSESEYAAWVYAHGFRPNHFTIYINYLKELNDIYKLNHFLKEHGFKLNSSGGEVKGSPNEFLEQSSTMAGSVPVKFIEGTFNIPSCYYEFAKRYPMKNGELYQGFIEKSADKIFESTNKRDSI